MTSSRVLVFYSRLPTPDMIGKTRIGKQIHDQSIANTLGKSLIFDMAKEYMPYNETDYDVVWYYRGDLSLFSKTSTLPVTTYIEQIEGELSIEYIHKKLSNTYTQVIIVGSDLPFISKKDIYTSFAILDTHDGVIVPTLYGGYGLIGMNGFTDVYLPITNWTSHSEGYQLLQETLQIVKKKQLSFCILPTVFDIDFLSDVYRLKDTISEQDTLLPTYQHLTNTFSTLSTHWSSFRPKLSIIIPTLNEGNQIVSTLRCFTHVLQSIEILLVDASSTDDTVRLARQTADTLSVPVRIITQTPKGRATQMNTGAHHAAGDTLLFLHADTHISPDSIHDLIQSLTDSLLIGGAFQIRFRESRLVYRLINLYSNVRAKIFCVFHGDQAIFIRKSVFMRLGMYPKVPLMEDVMLSHKMCDSGHVRLLSSTVDGSARRISETGILKSIGIYFMIKILYAFGVHPTRLARIYQKTKQS